MSDQPDQSPDTLQSASAEFDTHTDSIGSYTAHWWQSVRNGQLGAIPIIVGLAIISLVFGFLHEQFFSSTNFVNLILQMSHITAIAIGVVFVLLIAEIDLSVAFLSGVVAVAMVLMMRDPQGVVFGLGWPWWIALPAALLVGAFIGFLQGTVITKAGIPSFVVTLAGWLAWSGVVLVLMTELTTQGTILITDDVVLGIANSFLSPAMGWTLFAVIVLGFAGNQGLIDRARKKRGLPTKPASVIGLQVLAVAIVVGLAVFYANQDRGVPMVGIVLGLLLLFWSFIATRTRFGRHVYAIGGNPEAARRAGINVDRVKVMVFMISGIMAGVGGIILASRLRSVSTSTGSGNLLIQAIAAAVIGGTSLFGGRGAVVSALYGGLVIAAVENGMGLLLLPAGVKFIVTGLVLLAAVLIDSYSRKRQAASS